MAGARTSIIAAALLALAWTTDTRADGALQINSCQTLSSPNTTYRLTADLTSDGDCLIVAADRITIDLQGHSIMGTTGGFGITDASPPHDLVVIKNGTLSGYTEGISLASTRVSVIGVTVEKSRFGINLTGAQSLVKSCDSSGDFSGIVATGDRRAPRTTMCSRASGPATIV